MSMLCLFVVGGGCVAGERCFGIGDTLSVIDDFDIAASFCFDVFVVCKAKFVRCAVII